MLLETSVESRLSLPAESYAEMAKKYVVPYGKLATVYVWTLPTVTGEPG